MKYRLLIFSVLCSVAVAAVLYFRNSAEPSVKIDAGAANIEIPSTRSPSPELIPVPPATHMESVEPVSGAGSIVDEFNRATDYLDFGNSILARAKNGDPDAQYYLYAALEYCDEKYRYFFRRAKGGTRTLDEALTRVSTRVPEESMDVVRIAHERCSRMFDGGSQGLGTSDSWLKLATRSEQPVALVIAASDTLSHPTQGTGRDEAVKNGELMMMKALKSGNPEAMWRIGEIQPLLSDDDDEGMLRQWAWMLAACQRGYDCENSPWMEFSCRFDQQCVQDKNASDFIRRTTNLNFPEIESRAKEINAKIDAEAWDALERETTNKSGPG